jgi:2-polyprenyl-3-methyl-5-hydroxy-6-metoxy-1,4-benzoquinol methylase
MLPAGQTRSSFSAREFHLGRCPSCRCARVIDPRTDYDAIYDEAYYRGAGADPMVDYVTEMSDADTIRVFEWQAIERLVSSLAPLSPTTRWLDLGCGVGGLVRHLHTHGLERVVGADEGHGAELARAAGVPILDMPQLDAMDGAFDVVTSIEVIEHVVDPMAFIDRVSRLLAPGGIFVLTTGNVEQVRGELADWHYVNSDVHVTFLGPTSLTRAYERVGLRAETAPFDRPHVDLIRYKVLKSLGSPRRAAWHGAVPWGLVARLIDRRLGLTAMPFGRKPVCATSGS